MTKKTNYILKFSYTNNPASKKHFFDVKVLDGKTPVKGSGSNFSIGRVRNLDEAYTAMIEAGSKLAKKYGIDASQYVVSKENLIALSKIGGGSAKPKASPKAGAPVNVVEGHAAQFIERFGVEGRFKAMIKKAISLYGVEKVANALNAGLDEIKTAQEELAKELSIRHEANRKIADAILGARDAGVDMESPSDDVTALINMAIAQRERKNSRTNAGKQSGILYRHNGEEWYGNGQPPASFAKYLDEDESHTLEDLKVA